MSDQDPVIIPDATPANMHLYEIPALLIDEHENWLRPAYPRYDDELAPAKPFLVPSFDNDVVEINPSVKQDRKINFDEQVYVMEIENRFQMMLAEDQVDEEDEVSYEIEIVEGGQTDDADFYLEMIDGEIFYVFETEDDISEEGEDSDENSDESSESDDQPPAAPLQFDIAGMLAPNLDESVRSISDKLDADEDEDDTTSRQEDKSEKPDESEETEPVLEAVFESKSTSDPSHAANGTPSLASSPQPPISVDKFDETKSNADTIPSSQIEEQANQSSQDQRIEQPKQSQILNKRLESSNNQLHYSFSNESSPMDWSERGSPTPSSPKKSILKACPPSPKIDSPRKSKRERKAAKDKKKTFTKTYVRADDFDGEHRVYSWEKPAWASNSKLRSTGIGDGIRKGVSLAKPITDTKKLLKEENLKWQKPEWAEEDEEDKETDAKEELIRKIQSNGMNLPSRNKGGRRLKITLNGSSLREGSDIVKPITKATVIKKSSNVNPIANPKILRATLGGNKVKEGISLEAPTTQATNLKRYAFERPSWTQVKLNSTQAGDILKKGGDVVMPITPATADRNAAKAATEEANWKAKRGLGRQASASVVLEDSKRKEYAWEKPAWAMGMKLRKTPLGDDVRAGTADLSKPITSLPQMRRGLARSNSHDHFQINFDEQQSTGSSDSNSVVEDGGGPRRRTVRRSWNEKSKIIVDVSDNDNVKQNDESAVENMRSASADLYKSRQRPPIPRTKSMD